MTLGNGPSASHYAAPFYMLQSCSADPGSGTMAYEAPRGASGETQSTPRQSQMFQQNVTHIHGDVVAQQNNIDVEMMQQNAINLAEIRHETAIHEMQQTVVNVAESRHENVVNNLKQEAAIHYENKVLEVVTEASSHIEAANTRAADAAQQAKQALEQVQYMRTFMQAEIARQKAESQQEVARLQAEVQQRRLLPIVFNEQSTEAGSAGRCPSTNDVSTPPSTPTLKSKTKNFFESVFGNLNRPAMT